MAVAIPATSAVEACTFKDDAHKVDFVAGFNAFRRTGSFCDVTLQAGGIRVRAHKPVLKIIAPNLFTEFIETHNGDAPIVLDFLEGETLEKLVDYIYTGEIQLTVDDVHKIFESANRLTMGRLLDHCIAFVIKCITLSNCLELAAVAVCVNAPALKEECLMFIDTHLLNVVVNDANVYDVTPQLLAEIIKGASRTWVESLLVQQVEKWTSSVTVMSGQEKVNIWSKIRYGLLSANELGRIAKDPDHPHRHQFVREAMAIYQGPGNAERREQSGFFQRRLVASACRPSANETDATIKALAMIGGSNCFTSYASIATYDFENNVWLHDVNSADSNETAKLPYIQPLETPVEGHCAVVFNNTIYVLGGYNGNSTYKSVHFYESDKYRWTASVDMSSIRAFFGAVVLNDYIYAIGGDGEINDLYSAEKYDIQENKWQPIQRMNGRRACLATACLEQQIYAIGGRNQSWLTAERYNPLTNTWTAIANMTFKRTEACATSFNGRIYVVGGCLDLGSVEVYTPEFNLWQEIKSVTYNRLSANLIARNGYLYVVGGITGKEGFMERYEIDNNTWTVVNGNTPDARSHAATVLLNYSLLQTLY